MPCDPKERHSKYEAKLLTACGEEFILPPTGTALLYILHEM